MIMSLMRFSCWRITSFSQKNFHSCRIWQQLAVNWSFVSGKKGGGRKIWKRKGSIQLGNHLQTKLANYICNEMQSIRLHPYIQNNLFVPSGGDVTEGSSLQSARDLSQGSDMMICKGREGNPWFITHGGQHLWATLANKKFKRSKDWLKAIDLFFSL